MRRSAVVITTWGLVFLVMIAPALAGVIEAEGREIWTPGVDGVSEPVPEVAFAPEIPEHLASSGGEIVAVALVDADGSVSAVALRESTVAEPEVERLVRDSVAEWSFRPAARNGIPVASYAFVRIDVNVPVVGSFGGHTAPVAPVAGGSYRQGMAAFSTAHTKGHANDWIYEQLGEVPYYTGAGSGRTHLREYGELLYRRAEGSSVPNAQAYKIRQDAAVFRSYRSLSGPYVRNPQARPTVSQPECRRPTTIRPSSKR